MALNDRFQQNYPGVPLTTARAAGMTPSNWFARASGSKTGILKLDRREKILYSLAREWKEGKLLPPIDSSFLVWAAMVHDNYRNVATWLRDEMRKERQAGKIANEGEVAALAAYFVYKTMDRNGNLVKVQSADQVTAISEDFCRQLPEIRKISESRAVQDIFSGKTIQDIFIKVVEFDMSPKKAAVFVASGKKAGI